jgi:hypothetical protein
MIIVLDNVLKVITSELLFGLLEPVFFEYFHVKKLTHFLFHLILHLKAKLLPPLQLV